MRGIDRGGAQNRFKSFDFRQFGWSYPKLLLAALTIALVLTAIVLMSMTTAGFGAYNPGWDGTSEFRELADDRSELTVGTTAGHYGTLEADTATAIVMAPESEYDETETDQVRTFVEDGGTLVVADSFGPHGNQLLADVGANARFDGALLRDEQHYFRSPAMPVANNVDSHPTVRNVDQLTLNYGTAIESNGAIPIVTTSSFGYLDRDGSGSLSDDETIGNHSVVTVESVGDGTVIAIGDPSIFINAMIDEPDNRVFANNLVGSSEQVLLDYSHGASNPPLVSAMVTLQNVPTVAAIVGAIAVIIAAYAGGLYSRSNRRRSKERAVVDEATATEQLPAAVEPEVLPVQLQNKYPNWNSKQINRVVASIVHRREELDEE
ncbi:DUF4350 domain-containing protein [Halorubraceae archaeon YAN]|nr:DUF4350 domain-containing protein [Halorubraceae archaeon YAN]